MKVKSMFTPSLKNPKTGPCICQYIGETREESKKTCKGCTLLNSEPGKPKCYAQFKGMAWSHINMIKTNNYDYTLDGATTRDNKNKSRFIRMGGIGDPSATPAKELKAIKNHPLPVIGYTHFWRTRGKHLKDICVASGDTIHQADQAVALGWKASIVMPKGYANKVAYTPNGNKIILCPNQQNKKITCGTCMICSIGKKSAPVIAFAYH